MDNEKAGGWLWYSAGHWSEAACDCDVIMEEGAAAAALQAAGSPTFVVFFLPFIETFIRPNIKRKQDRRVEQKHQIFVDIHYLLSTLSGYPPWPH